MIFGIIGAAIAGIASVASTIGSVLTATVKTIVALTPTIEKMITFVQLVTNVGQILGVVKPNENLEDLGAKVLQPETRPRMPTESAEEYLNYLRNDVKLDQTRKEHMNESDKFLCNLVGASIGLNASSEHLGIDMSPQFINATIKAGLKGQEVVKIAQQLERCGMECDKFNDYMKNSLSDNDIETVDAAIKGMVKEIYPDFTDKEIRAEINQMFREFGSN